jgi:glycosyltransferase involved in cell wall biosynthesis
VLHVVPFLWSGAGQVIASLCESQAQAHPVAIVTSGRAHGQRDWPAYRRRLATASIPHTSIDFFSRDSGDFWRGVQALGHLVNTWRPDIVHAHAGVPAVAAAMVRGPGRSFSLVNHVYSWGVDRPEWMNDMDVWGHRQADVVVCSADAYERILRTAGVSPDRIQKVRWGLAPAALTTTATTNGHATTVRRTASLRIGFVGRIEPRKGQLDLVRAVALARRRLPNLTLDLVGPVADESYAARLRDEIETLGLARSVRLRGRVLSVPAVVSSWNLFVSLSSDEGQGLAILEAMALGIPVAARVVAGVEDYFAPDVNGVPLTSRQPSHVSRVIVDALGDTDRLGRLATRARAMAARDFSWDRTVRAIARVYRDARQHRQDAVRERRR